MSNYWNDAKFNKKNILPVCDTYKSKNEIQEGRKEERKGVDTFEETVHC